jgi:shikimate kinase
MSMRPIFLVGYMGSGKSTVGKMISARLGFQLIDLDAFIETRFHKTIAQLFDEKGENEFRNLEHALLREVCGFEDTVIATGGGAACFHGNMSLMNESGLTVYLRVPVDILAERLKYGRSQRPLISQKSDEELHAFIEDMLQMRDPFYAQAQMTVDSRAVLDFGFVDDIVARVEQERVG